MLLHVGCKASCAVLVVNSYETVTVRSGPPVVVGYMPASALPLNCLKRLTLTVLATDH